MLRLFFLFVFISLPACTSYRTAKNIKLVGFSDNIVKGRAIGQVKGDDCTFMVLGAMLGGPPTISTAIANARQNRRAEFGDFLGGQTKSRGGIRYMNNLSARPTGFNVGGFGKSCIEVTGLGYK